MLAKDNWLNTFFDQAADAIMIFKDDQLVLANRTAQNLQRDFNLDLNYLLELVQSEIDRQNTDFNNCNNCEILKKMSKISIPLTLDQDSTHPLEFSLIYSVIDADNNVYSLVLKSHDALKRVDQVELQKQLTQYVNQAHEDERKRISQDLHDSIAQGIYSAIRGLRRLEDDNLPDSERQYLNSMVEAQLDDTLHEVKTMALDIRPTVLDSFGLSAAIRALVKRSIENTGIEIDFIDHAQTDHLPKKMQNVLYRVTQESINNALKHANPNEISIVLVSHDHFIKLEVIDDGVGFDYHAGQFNGHSLGLMNMDERVRALNGFFNIESAPGKGTTVSVKFPIKNK
ncbi:MULTISPECIES: sensor histidine kinase [Lactobacillus]|uniref:Sensor histidine kinase n=1 Tax=Lactobacillus xujianguonis TaxID=2495899 RepID=A0A437SVM2_9LACO|nr:MULTISPECIES: sensor histidine kinase [Lactobacillus]RVU70974.1 sensor histidine kinase [Lactobacillus xujianguonis]RVU73407.1 sensor histidine kinase [Lactobacillus xujianguonis]